MNSKKYGMIFNTKNNNYYYDTATGKVVSCNDMEIETIDNILLEKVDLEEECSKNKIFGDFVAREKLFNDNENWGFLLPTRQEFKELVRGKCEQIVLELTEDCNLRCGYCIYNDHHKKHRKFSNKTMSFDIAKRSIDFVMQEYQGDEFALTFYGGEPLMNFKVMKRTIEYFKKQYPMVEKSFGFTTNLTLLDDEMIEYFSNLNELEIVCSLDGPQSLHDKFRRDLHGNGSHDIATSNFIKLMKKFYNKKAGRTLMVNCVITPPYTKEKLDEISGYFRAELHVPKEIDINYSYVDAGDMVFDYDRKEVIETTSKIEISPLEYWAVTDFEINGSNSEYFGLINKELARVSDRMKSDNIINGSYLHGNCLPGQRRLYVTIDGNFRTCEKVGNIPTLGDCFIGYDYDKSYDIYLKNYAQEYHEKCKNCWARTMCAMCYESSLNTDNNNLYKVEGICDISKQIIKDMFVNYFTLYEKNPEALKRALSEIEFK